MLLTTNECVDMLCVVFMFSINQCLASLPLFFFNDTSTTELYTLSLHDALPISEIIMLLTSVNTDTDFVLGRSPADQVVATMTDRKSTRLNSSHQIISYAVFCWKTKEDGRNTHHVTNNMLNFMQN